MFWTFNTYFFFHEFNKKDETLKKPNNFINFELINVFTPGTIKYNASQIVGEAAFQLGQKK